MLCPHCQVENRDIRRFCAGCGKALPRACAACGFQNRADEKFCGGCGCDLSVTTETPESRAAGGGVRDSGGDRRPVTVMFVDLSGYTALSAALDPEDTHRLLRRFFELVDGIVIGFGGTIDKHIGDSVMALFGAPIAHGNDPERAIRAALDMHASMSGLCAEFGRDLTVHVGIALGEVMASGLGSTAHSAYTVTGEAANLAARLMERAAPRETLVSDALRHAVDNLALFEAIGGLQLKGLAHPEPTHRLVALRPAPLAEPEMVGRQSEVRQLLAMLDACRGERVGAALVIRGDPGIGKSRLMRELKRAAMARGFTCISGLILDFGAYKGEDAMAAITAGLLGTTLDADSDVKNRAIADAAARGAVDTAAAPFLRDLLGLAQPSESQSIYAAMDASARRRGMAAALDKLLRSASQETPCLIAIEDAHWADETALFLLSSMVKSVGDCAAILAMSTRVEGDPFTQAWRSQAGGGPSATMDLRPLRSEEALSLAAGVVGEIGNFARQCIARAEGNPLFLEQLLRAHLTDNTGKLPHSVQGVVLARLDNLGETERRALQAASVLGQRFLLEDLRRLIDQPDYDCRTMLDRQLLRVEGEGLLFAHALIRDGVYASLTRERKRALHLRAAAGFAGRDPTLEAEHLDRGEDSGAPLAYLRAAEAEAATYHLDRANALVARGLELATKDEDRVRLGLAAGRLSLDIGLAKPARAAFDIAVAAAIRDVDRCRGLIGLAAADRMLADLGQAMESLALAQVIATSVDLPALLSEIHYLRGNLYFARGEGASCEKEHRLALAAAERAGLPEWKARARSGLGDAAYLQGRAGTARRQFEVCVGLAQRHDLLRIIPANRCMIGNCMTFYLDFDDALREVGEARIAAIKIGDRFVEMFASQVASYILFAARRWRETEAPAVAALDLAIALGARRYEAFLMMTLGRVRLALGHTAEGAKLIDAAMLLAEETGLGFAGPVISACQALVRGPGAEGRACIARGEAMLKDIGLLHNHVFFRGIAIDWAIEAGDWPLVEDQAVGLSTFMSAEPSPYTDLVTNWARALAALHRNPNDSQVIKTLQRCRAKASAVDFRLDFPPQSA